MVIFEYSAKVPKQTSKQVEAESGTDVRDYKLLIFGWYTQGSEYNSVVSREDEIIL